MSIDALFELECSVLELFETLLRTKMPFCRVRQDENTSIHNFFIEVQRANLFGIQVSPSPIGYRTYIYKFTRQKDGTDTIISIRRTNTHTIASLHELIPFLEREIST